MSPNYKNGKRLGPGGQRNKMSASDAAALIQEREAKAKATAVKTPPVKKTAVINGKQKHGQTLKKGKV